MANEPDFLYEKAPLVEVIAELHWKLQPLTTAPNAAIDPHWDVFSQAFEAEARNKGLQFIEEVVPDMVPREFIPHQVCRRFRLGRDRWPLYQIGPGILAVNIVPPYKGWREFSAFLTEGVQMLWAAYPLADRYLKIEKLELRYIDAFTSLHGMSNQAEFLRADVGLARDLPQSIMNLGSGSRVLAPTRLSRSARARVIQAAGIFPTLIRRSLAGWRIPRTSFFFRAAIGGSHPRPGGATWSG